MSRHGLEMKGFGMQPALSSPSLDRACLRDGGSSSSKVDVTSEKIRSLMNILGEKSQLIERCVSLAAIPRYSICMCSLYPL